MKIVSNDTYSFVYGYKEDRKPVVMTDEQFDKFYAMYTLKLDAMIQRWRENDDRH